MFSSLISDFEACDGVVAGNLENAASQGVLWQAKKGEFLLNVPGVARYLVAEGRTVTIDRVPDVSEAEVDRFFRLTPWAALLFQRGVLAFHAAAVTRGQGAIMIAGDSGAGKSTLLAELLRRGWMMLADEVSVVDVSASGQPVVYSTERSYVLWPDAAEHFGITASQPCTGTAQQPHMAEAQPLRQFCWLQVSYRNEVEREDIGGSKRFRTLNRALYTAHIADALLDRAQYLRKAMAITQTTDMQTVLRPRTGWTVRKVADLLEEQAP